MSRVEILEWIELSALTIEVIAVLIMFVSIMVGTAIYLLTLLRRRIDGHNDYELYRQRIGRALLAGLEILVAADIIRTVALDATMQALLVLGMLVVIRTFLSWTLTLEVEGRWPWARERGTRRPSDERRIE